MDRRSMLKAMAAALAAALYLPATQAEAAWGGGFAGYVYNGGVPSFTYAYLFSGPTTSAAWLANVPIGSPVMVVGASTGDELAPHNPIWYDVVAPQGGGWVYSGMITNIPPVSLTAAQVAPPPGPVPGPAGNGVGRSIWISLSRQHLYAYDGTTLAYDTVVTTGDPEKPTPTGYYVIQDKIPNFVFRSPWPVGSPLWYPVSPVHYAMLFREGGYYIHDAPWRPYYGPGTNLPHLDPDGAVRAGSHGCVNVPLVAETFLFGWTPIGAPVMIIA